jgi:hypothetical protein
MPGVPHPIPSRTRSLSSPGPMVLRLKAWESRSLPGLHDAPDEETPSFISTGPPPVRSPVAFAAGLSYLKRVHADAGWSSPVARQAHNLKVVGSNPAPAPILLERGSRGHKQPRRHWRGCFRLWRAVAELVAKLGDQAPSPISSGGSQRRRQTNSQKANEPASGRTETAETRS